MVLIIKAVTSEANNITVKKYAYGVTLSMVNGLIKRNEAKIAEISCYFIKIRLALNYFTLLP